MSAGARTLRGLVAPGIAAAVVCAILVGLGTWQIQRLAWKEKLIADVTARTGAAPRAAPAPDAWAGINFGDVEYLPVSVGGVFRNDEEIHVTYALTAPKGRYGGFGAMVVTPFVTDGGWTVYVNRGFVPEPNIDPATRTGGQITGHTTAVGLVRAPADRAWFMPGDDVAKNIWTSRDPRLYAAAQGLSAANVAPYIIDASFDPSLPGGMPQGGETIVTFPNNHLGYAITWYGLALCCAAIYVAFAARRLRKPPDAGA